MKKGLLITQDITAGNSGFSLNQPLSPQKLRQYALFWDEIACPQSNIFHFGMGPDYEYLIEAGIAKYETVNFSGSTRGDAKYWIELQEAAFQKLTMRDESKWSLASEVKSLGMSSPSQHAHSTLCLHLVDSIQVFTGDVPLAEILEFKQRRHDELIEFRDSIDELVEQTIFTADTSEAIKRQIRKVERDLNEVNRVMSESRYPTLKTCATNVLTADGVLGLVAPALLAMGLPLESNVKTALAIGSGIAFSLYKGRHTNVLPRNLKQYAYVAHARKELI
ncbi:DUF6236 family protein [Shewanella algae]